jgi:predicted site-specific integrase-resolvase
MKTEYVGVPAAARRLGVEIKRIYELLYSGKLAGAEKQNGRWRIPEAAIEARLRARAAKDAA